ncbi:MAG: diacylglycerol kinase family protein [Cyclobacteriaceae bacterium]|nr:diacylglycerol kinase family protein [Cyclobacteriaceae bacterium]
MNAFLKSFRYAVKGIKVVVKEQRNFKILLFIAAIVIAFGFYFSITTAEWIAIILVIGMVLAMEMINTSIEYIINMISPEYSHVAGKIKDIAAGATMIAAIASVIIGFIIFKKYLLG